MKIRITKIFAFVLVLSFIISTFVGCDSKGKDYDEALRLFNAGLYEEAKSAFVKLDDYKNAAEIINDYDRYVELSEMRKNFKSSDVRITGMFYEGLSWIALDNNRECFVNTDGGLVLECMLWDNANSFSDGVAHVKNKYPEIDAFIDAQGNTVLDCKKIKCSWDSIGDFSEGLANISYNHKYGFINKEGELVIDQIYDSYYPFEDGIAPVEKDEKWGYIDNQGNVLVDFIYDEARPNGVVQKGEKWGIINCNNGEIISDFTWDYIGPFSKIPNSEQKLAIVEKSEKRGYIDIEGNLVIDCKYNTASSFSDGKAKVGNTFINDNGEELFTLHGDCGTFSEYYFAEYYGVSTTDILFFDDSYSDGLIMVMYNDKYGYNDENGANIIEPQYDDAHWFSDGHALVQKSGKTYVIDKQGTRTELSAPEFVLK